MIKGLRQKSFILTVCLGLMVTNASKSYGSSPLSGDLTRQYQLEYHTWRVNNMAALWATALENNRVQLLANLINGDFIVAEKVNIKSVETIPGEARTINLLYTLEGQPDKACFTRELKMVMRLPSPGIYRVKLWIHELYHDRGEVLLGEKEILAD